MEEFSQPTTPVFALFLAAFVLGAVPLMGQQTGGRSPDFNEELSMDLSAEESYLRDSVELMIIREQSRGETREMKLRALTAMRDSGVFERALSHEAGAMNEKDRKELYGILNYLAMEGIVNQTYQNGSLSNNFPVVRAQSAALLGELGGSEAKGILLKMIPAETSSQVLIEVIRALAKIGAKPGDGTVKKITYSMERFDSRYGIDNLLALTLVEAFETFAAGAEGRPDQSGASLLEKIAQGRYRGSTRARARALLMKR